jgi:hypothetical protein
LHLAVRQLLGKRVGTSPCEPPARLPLLLQLGLALKRFGHEWIEDAQRKAGPIQPPLQLTSRRRSACTTGLSALHGALQRVDRATEFPEVIATHHRHQHAGVLLGVAHHPARRGQQLDDAGLPRRCDDRRELWLHVRPEARRCRDRAQLVLEQFLAREMGFDARLATPPAVEILFLLSRRQPFHCLVQRLAGVGGVHAGQQLRMLVEKGLDLNERRLFYANVCSHSASWKGSWW